VYAPENNISSTPGYFNGITSKTYVAYGFDFRKTASFSAQDTTVFSLLSIYATSAYDEQNFLTIKGYNATDMVVEKTVPINANTPSYVVFDSSFTNLTKIGLDTSLREFAIDDIRLCLS